MIPDVCIFQKSIVYFHECQNVRYYNFVCKKVVTFIFIIIVRNELQILCVRVLHIQSDISITIFSYYVVWVIIYLYY